MRDAFVRALTGLAERDERVMLITGDLGFGVLDAFAQRFPERFLNAGVAEQSMTGLATGLALEGRVVFTYSIGNFPTLRCLEQIRNDACYHGADVKIVCIGGGFSYGALGASHFATEDLAILRALPGTTVVAPCTTREAEDATAAIAATPGPCYLRLDRSAATEPPTAAQPFALGRARVLAEGRDVALVACGGIMAEALAAAAILGSEGVACRVVSMHTVKPLDVAAIADAAARTRGIVTVEEHTLAGGLGGAVAEAIADHGIPCGFLARVGLPSAFPDVVGGQAYLRARYGLDAVAIAERVRVALAAADARRARA